MRGGAELEPEPYPEPDHDFNYDTFCLSLDLTPETTTFAPEQLNKIISYFMGKQYGINITEYLGYRESLSIEDICRNSNISSFVMSAQQEPVFDEPEPEPEPGPEPEDSNDLCIKNLLNNCLQGVLMTIFHFLEDKYFHDNVEDFMREFKSVFDLKPKLVSEPTANDKHKENIERLEQEINDFKATHDLLKDQGIDIESRHIEHLEELKTELRTLKDEQAPLPQLKEEYQADVFVPLEEVVDYAHPPPELDTEPGLRESFPFPNYWGFNETIQITGLPPVHIQDLAMLSIFAKSKIPDCLLRFSNLPTMKEGQLGSKLGRGDKLYIDHDPKPEKEHFFLTRMIYDSMGYQSEETFGGGTYEENPLIKDPVHSNPLHHFKEYPSYQLEDDEKNKIKTYIVEYLNKQDGEKFYPLDEYLIGLIGDIFQENLRVVISEEWDGVVIDDIPGMRALIVLVKYKKIAQKVKEHIVSANNKSRDALTGAVANVESDQDRILQELRANLAHDAFQIKDILKDGLTIEDIMIEPASFRTIWANLPDAVRSTHRLNGDVDSRAQYDTQSYFTTTGTLADVNLKEEASNDLNLKPEFSVKLIENYNLWKKYNVKKNKYIKSLDDKAATYIQARVRDRQARQARQDGQSGGARQDGYAFHKKMPEPFVIREDINEMYLFHGTSEQGVNAVLKGNFKEAVAGEGLYGKYCYFTNHLCKAIQYAKAFKYRDEILFLQKENGDKVEDSGSDVTLNITNNTGGILKLLFTKIDGTDITLDLPHDPDKALALTTKNGTLIGVVGLDSSVESSFVCSTFSKNTDILLLLHEDYRWPVFLARVLMGPNPYTTYNNRQHSSGIDDIRRMRDNYEGRRTKEGPPDSLFAQGFIDAKRDDFPVTTREGMTTIAGRITHNTSGAEALKTCEERGWGQDCLYYPALSGFGGRADHIVFLKGQTPGDKLEPKVNQLQVHNEFMVAECEENVYPEYLLLFKYSSYEDMFNIYPHIQNGYIIQKPI